MRWLRTSGQDVPAAPREGVIGDSIAWTARWSLQWVCHRAGAVLLGLIVMGTWVAVLPVIWR